MGAVATSTLPLAALDSLDVALVVVDRTGTIAYANAAAHALVGGTTALVETKVTALLTDTGTLLEEISTAVRSGHSWAGEIALPRPDGSTLTVRTRAVPICEGTERVGTLGLIEPPSSQLGPLLLADHAVELTRVVADVAGAEHLGEAAQLITDHAVAALGARSALFGVLEGPGTIRAAGLRVLPGTDRRRWQRLDVSECNPLSEAVRTRQVVAASSAAESARRWPAWANAPAHDGSLAAVPLVTGGRCVGVLGLGFADERPLREWERRYLEALAESCAQAVERITARAAAEQANAKLSFLASASEALAASLDYEETLRTVADLAVPHLADWCTIDVLEEGHIRRVAVSHIDPGKVAMAWELWGRYPTDLEAPTGAGAVLRSGTSELVETVDEQVLDERAVAPEIRRLVEKLQLNSALTVALRARGRTLGVLSLVYAESGRHFLPADVAFAEELARRAALAIDNAQLYTETLQVALQLQRAILPESYADMENWRVAVHYRPAGRSDVGGDFFDAQTLRDGRLVALVGDVMGRGVAAAAAMAQVRAAVRAYLVVDPDPGAVLTRLDQMFAELAFPQLVTLVYGVLDPHRNISAWHSAGHLPPLLVHGDGNVERLSLPTAPPLGAGIFRRDATIVPFSPSDALVLYSDGLVERRGEDIDEGMARLERLASPLAVDLSDSALAILADELRQRGHDDDVTVLGLRARRAASPES